MPLSVTCKNLQRGPFQRLLFTIESNFENLRHARSITLIKESILDTDGRFAEKIVDVCFEFEHYVLEFKPSEENSLEIYVRIATMICKSATPKHHPIILKVTCNELNFSEYITCTGFWLDFILVGEKKVILKQDQYKILTNLEINLSIHKVEPVTFAKLYDDTVLTDFNLSTAEGSIAVHKVCLAAHSDVFKTMFNGPWKNTTDGRVAPGITLSSLQHFKDYVYLGKLPDDEEDLQSLLLLSSYYFVETLETECISKLMGLVKPENLYSLLEFACKNNIPDLTFAMLLQVPDDVVHKSYELRKSKQTGAEEDKEKCVS